MKKFELKIGINLKTLNDLITTAVEGGSNYWYAIGEEACEKIRKHKGIYVPEIHGDKQFFYGTFSEAILPTVFDGFPVAIYDVENPDDRIGVLSISSIQKGLQKMITDGRRESVILIDPNVDWDAGDADVIFQYMVLNELVYG